jgi:hypothetical protein
MKTAPKTVITELAFRLREQSKRFNPGLESAPVAVLWTDERGDWAGVLPQLKSALPELFSLGDYQPQERTGPGIWLRMVADGQAGGLAAVQVPIIYLPGVANASLRTDLRTVKDDPQLSPLAELQYRGTFWRQENSKDWTLRAFFESKRSGLGVACKGDQATLAALKQVLPKLLSRSLVTLQGRVIDLAFLDEILNPNPADDVLRWLVAPDALQQEKAEGWTSFVASTQQRYGVDLQKGALNAAATVLSAKESEPAFGLWEKFAYRPDEQPGLYEVFKAVSPPDLISGAERYPRENDQDEVALSQAFRGLALMDSAQAATKIIALEAQHGARRSTVWASLGHAPMALALEPLSRIAHAVMQPTAGGSVAHQAEVWAAEGWKVDASAMTALALAQAADRLADIEPALMALYRPWLQLSAQAFQQRVLSEGYPARVLDVVPDDTVVLFVDGLRLDLARQLELALAEVGLSVKLQHRLTSVPSVTSSGKVWCSPGYTAAQVTTFADGFEPLIRVGDSDAAYTAERLRRAMAADGFAVVNPDAPEMASSQRAWAEFADDIDSDGHRKGLRLAQEAPRHVAKLAKAVQRLLNVGWQRVRVVTDHGWLLLPGGLPKVELDPKLLDTKWARCAVVKDAAASVEAMTLPWSYGPTVRIALAPGIGAFRAGQVYDHGGLSLQECVVPVVDVVSNQPAKSRVAIKAVTWNTRKTICSVQTAGADGLMVVLERLGNIVIESDGAIADDKGRLVLDEVDDLLGETVSIVLRRDGQNLAVEQMKFGEAWHAA